MINSLLQQLKKRRLALGMKQKDMMLRIGISRQQYQQLESKGNPRLNTLSLVSKGLKSELMLIPDEKVNLVQELLENDSLGSATISSLLKNEVSKQEENTLANDPWEHLLGDDE